MKSKTLKFEYLKKEAFQMKKKFFFIVSKMLPFRPKKTSKIKSNLTFYPKSSEYIRGVFRT